MPLGLKPTCSVCRTTSSSMWKKGGQGEILCNNCTGRPGPPGAGGAAYATTSAAAQHSNGGSGGGSGGGGKQVRRPPSLRGRRQPPVIIGRRTAVLRRGWVGRTSNARKRWPPAVEAARVRVGPFTFILRCRRERGVASSSASEKRRA